MSPSSGRGGKRKTRGLAQGLQGGSPAWRDRAPEPGRAREPVSGALSTLTEIGSSTTARPKFSAPASSMVGLTQVFLRQAAIRLRIIAFRVVERGVRELGERVVDLPQMLRRRAEAKERAEREARQRREERWRREEERREAERLLDACYSICRRHAYLDIGSPYGPTWPRDTPHWLDDWPNPRPGWWAPPPGLLEAAMAEPTCKPFGHQEPDWRRWVPKYVPGQPWPWRKADPPSIELIQAHGPT